VFQTVSWTNSELAYHHNWTSFLTSKDRQILLTGTFTTCMYVTINLQLLYMRHKCCMSQVQCKTGCGICWYTSNAHKPIPNGQQSSPEILVSFKGISHSKQPQFYHLSS